MHGERWYAPESATVDVYAVGTPHAPPGVRVRRLERALPADQVVRVDGMPLTTVARTAIDVARWENDDDSAIAKIDAICNRSRTDMSVVRAAAGELGRLHGLPRVRELLRWCDRRADSPPETRLRLLIVRAGLPVPTPQLEIVNEYGAKVATADLGYEKQKVAIFYDSELHRRKHSWEYDAWANAELAELGWTVIRVTAQMLRNPLVVLRQIEAALSRGRMAP